MLNQVTEQPVFFRQKLHLRIVAPHFPAAKIDADSIEVIDLGRLVGGRDRRPSQQRFHPRQELNRLEGLDQVIIGAEFQPDDAVHDLPPRSEHQYRNVDPTLSKVTADVEAASERQHHVQDNERSEEHTSELQSLTNLVCRLLLEKKKTY